MKRIRFPRAVGVVLAVTGVSLVVLLGVRRVEAAQSDLSQADLDVIVAQAVASASLTNSGFRTSPTVQKTKMQIAIVARDGKLLRVFSMADAWVGSIDIAIAKARTGAFFSSNQNALTSRIVGQASQPGAPLWGIGNSNQLGISGSAEFRNRNHHLPRRRAALQERAARWRYRRERRRGRSGRSRGVRRRCGI